MPTQTTLVLNYRPKLIESFSWLQMFEKEYKSINSRLDLIIIYLPLSCSGRLTKRAMISSMLQTNKRNKHLHERKLEKEERRERERFDGIGKEPCVTGEDADPSRRGEHDEGDINITKHRKLVGFLNQSISSLGESDLPICSVLYFLDLELHSPHHY